MNNLAFSEESAVLDLDGAGGKTFLRVLLHLGMHDYPPLVSGALRLLFRHFSQRQEVLQAFKQVVKIKIVKVVKGQMFSFIRAWYKKNINKSLV